LSTLTDMTSPDLKTRRIILEVSGLTAGYFGKPVVQNLHLAIREGEFIGLVGHNGSGKSTVLLGIAGLTWGSADKIVLLDQNIGTLPAHKRIRAGLGLLLQRDGLFSDLSIEANLLLAGVESNESTTFLQSGELAEILRSILKRLSEHAGSLSGGERRLLSLALILAKKPAVLLADEPTLGLSEGLENAVMEFLRSYASAANRAVLVVSHKLNQVQEMCDRAYVIEQGVIQCEFCPGRSGRSLEETLRKSI